MKLTFNKFNNIEIIPFALSDIPHRSNISGSGIGSSIDSSKTGISVEVTTIDRLFFEKGIPINYIKADLEGHDYATIKGAEKIIQKYKPKISITTYHNKNHAELINNFLKSIEPKYQVKTKGIFANDGSPVMLHAWVS
jgi:hypothetical protein